jgi:hypothetical protein
VSQVPVDALSIEPSVVAPVMMGTAQARGISATGAVKAVTAQVLPTEFVATTAARSSWPPWPLVGVNEGTLAPAMSAQLAPVAPQSSQMMP